MNNHHIHTNHLFKCQNQKCKQRNQPIQKEGISIIDNSIYQAVCKVCTTTFRVCIFCLKRFAKKNWNHICLHKCIHNISDMEDNNNSTNDFDLDNNEDCASPDFMSIPF